jgi:hypothetical protein
MIFINFFRFYLAREAPKPTRSVLPKTGPVNRQNRSIYQNFIRFIAQIQTFQRFAFYIRPILSVFNKIDNTGPIQFSKLCRFYGREQGPSCSSAAFQM